jgi:hypothetical protein
MWLLLDADGDDILLCTSVDSSKAEFRLVPQPLLRAKLDFPLRSATGGTNESQVLGFLK